MNTEQLNSIKERAAKATVGPWKLDTYDMTIRSTNDKHTVVCVPTFNTYDSELIASSREDIPALVAEVERLQQENESLKHSLQYIANRRESNQDWTVAHNVLAVYGRPKEAK